MGNSNLEEDNRPDFKRRTSESDFANVPLKSDENTDFGFTTDGEINRHTPTKKFAQISDRRDLEKRHYDMINERVVEDITMDFLYKPHSITVLVCFVGFLVYKAFYSTNSNSTEKNYYDGFLGAIALFLIISGLTLPNGPFIRPHPIIWRVIFGLSVVYVIILQFTLFQNYEDLKRILTWLDPVGLSHKNLKEKEYAVDCWNLSLEKMWSHVDFFAFSHFTGWIMKTLLIRHWVLSWYISIMWEFTELIFVSLLPNFAECWWDAIILDILVCNGLGIYVGMKLCQFLQMREFHWESLRNIKSRKGKMKRFALQFTPASWNQCDWVYSKTLSNNIRQTGALFFFVIFWMLAELNTFFIKHIFAIDTQHPVVFWRIILIAVISAPTIRQYYVFVTDPLTKRVGMQTWVFVVICILEMTICVKFGRTVFEKLDISLLLIWLFCLLIGSALCIMLSTWYAASFGRTESLMVRGRHRLCYLDSSYEDLGSLEDDVKKRRKEYLSTSPKFSK